MDIRPIQTLLIANRGEITRRIIRTCRRLGIRTVAVFSEADKLAPFVREADTAVYIGSATPSESYLNETSIIEAAKRTGADAIHPGYGFLSERAGFAQKVAEAGLRFVGPSAQSIEAMGSKNAARKRVATSGVPVAPGYDGDDQSLERLTQEAERVGFPLLVKAASGGGGKGMRIVRQPSELAEALSSARREAESAFGDGNLLLERYLTESRHVEIQVLGDQHGHVIHLGERECSLQRRYQKVLEESPSSVLAPELRAQMGEAAVAAAKSVGYYNAGTVEFLLAADGQFYFLEMNTRLQVEHPVTELVTGLDLVEWQLRIAEGRPLTLQQTDIRQEGYAVEVRLYAEDVEKGFLPVAGPVHTFDASRSPIRVDAGVESGSEVSIWYDPMLAKLIAHGTDRADGLRRLAYGIDQLTVLGLKTNLGFLKQLIAHPAVQKGDYHTHWLEAHLADFQQQEVSAEHTLLAALGAFIHRRGQISTQRTLLATLPAGWRNSFYEHEAETYTIEGQSIELKYRALGDTRYEVLAQEKQYELEVLTNDKGQVGFLLDNQRHTAYLHAESSQTWVHLPSIGTFEVELAARFPMAEESLAKSGYRATMPSQVVRVLVEAGAAVEAGTGLVVLSSMKMETTIHAAEAGTVREVYVEAGQFVPADTTLLEFEVA
jgi:acetyl/propionyl-CoA carboxylase alpha subunit